MKLRGYLFAAATAVTAACLTVPAQAASLFNNSNPISFSKDTRVEFKFHASHGAYQSTLAVYNSNRQRLQNLFVEDLPRDPISGGKTNQYNNVDSRGTCGVTVNPAPCVTTYTFLANTSYYLGLSSLGINTTVFSDDPVGGATPGGFRFVADVDSVLYPTKYAPPTGANFKSLPLQNGETAILINDSSPVDRDANDFVVTAKSVPEPATLAGLGVVAAGLAASRRRKAGQTA
ncbi:PEP-CTERM sorting domain-containing protein [Oculatella sp. FACHB-28]|nr:MULTISPECIES: PEP-CTERM sorting domain-containing protein [Cyanophyceae]MBD1871732.1 PEP-CTERM sorting domain-containing protein [Cyanobacteria bacterium FACHB-471]MBD1996606.1 PEP-CTERM sorting domain-containing protein [Leptolyngbya sp. FACHB-541]MBD2057739.1 PEP-CTERM sorting domain-containing protein [Oculatella sp. FACHB-28]MBD2071638.1 PEP-CTERM sorting domain-containing protein [Leptolyngbya sp. FACHB-671]